MDSDIGIITTLKYYSQINIFCTEEYNEEVIRKRDHIC
jgi:hypothetical protein